MKQFSSLFIILFLIIACQSQVDVTETIPANTATPEITLTSTSQPTTHPQATPTQALSIEFPEWVKNPDTQILLVPVGTRAKGYENMALFNAETGERFDIPFTEKVGDYFWMPDGSAFGFLPIKKKEAMIFSIENNVANKVMLSDSAFKFFLRSYSASPPESIQVSSSNPQDTNFLLISFWESLSPNKNFFTHQEEYDNTYTSIFDISSNETIYISDPNDGYFDLYSEFSPDSKFIAISQSNEDPGIHTTFQTLPTIRLRVYDIQSQELVASYKNVTFPKWSPDGTKFLFQEWEKHEIIGWYSYWDSPPCVYNTLDGLTNCYNQTLVDEVNQFSSLDWSPNQSMISYVFHDKGLCTIILSTSKIECILDYANIEENYIRGYSWSPNSNFISFEFDSVGPYSDDNDHPKLGIANIKTGEYFFVSDNINMHQLGIWRSIPNQ